MNAFTVEKMNDQTKVYIHCNLGESDCVAELEHIMNRLLDDGEKEIILDMENTQTIIPSNLGIILKFYRDLRDRGGRLYTAPRKGEIKFIFQTLNLDKLIPEYTG
jgi:anti-anti-sigma regulatory factor